MKLNPSPFEKIKSGQKTIELRLFDEKRQKIKAGDDIIFTNSVNGEKICTTVKKLHLFDSFDELYKSLPLLQCGYTSEDIGTAHHSDMERYYSTEEQSKYGVVGIELFPPKRIADESVVCITQQDDFPSHLWRTIKKNNGMFDITDENVLEVYTQLKDKYDLVLTSTAALNEGFTVDCPIIVGKDHGQILELYSSDDMFVLDVMDAAQTKGTHWHPSDVDSAVRYIEEFMEGKSDYELFPFPEHI